MTKCVPIFIPAYVTYKPTIVWDLFFIAERIATHSPGTLGMSKNIIKHQCSHYVPSRRILPHWTKYSPKIMESGPPIDAVIEDVDNIAGWRVVTLPSRNPWMDSAEDVDADCFNTNVNSRVLTQPSTRYHPRSNDSMIKPFIPQDDSLATIWRLPSTKEHFANHIDLATHIPFQISPSYHTKSTRMMLPATICMSHRL